MTQHVTRFKKLAELTPEQMEQLDALLLDGKPAMAIAKLMQEEWGVLKGDKPDTIKKMLERYRSQDLRSRTIQTIAAQVTGAHLGGITKKLNAVEELAQLTQVQKTRFEKALKLEEGKPLLLQSTTGEAKLFKEMLVELGKLQLETGIIQRAPKKLTGSITDADGTVKQFEWSEEQEALYRNLEAFEDNGVFEVG